MSNRWKPKNGERSVYEYDHNVLLKLFLNISAVAAEQTLNEGQSLLDQLALPVKNAFGKDITPDNKPHIEHVQKMMEDLQVGGSSLSRVLWY